MSTCIFTEENKMSLFWFLAYSREICCLKKKIVFSSQLIKILQQKTLLSSQVRISTGKLIKILHQKTFFFLLCNVIFTGQLL